MDTETLQVGHESMSKSKTDFTLIAAMAATATRVLLHINEL